MLPAQKPQAVTGSATNLAGTTAELQGDVFAGGAATSYNFDYGLTTNYGLKSTSRPIGSESRWIHISETLSNLTIGATYHYRLVATSAQGTSFGADAEFTTVQFSAFAHIGASNAIYGVTPGDFDNDGDLDFAVTFSGNYTGRIYRNDGNGSFSDIGLDLIRSDGYQPEWADYDNDGDLDLAIGAWTYYPNESFAPLIYRNEGNGVFTTANPPSYYTLARGPLYWADFDNDADPDLLFIIQSEGARFYRNDGGRLLNQGLIFGSSANSSAAVGDFDNDGDLDVVLTGVFSSAYKTTLWLNAGNGSFYASPQSFTGMAGGCATCGDLDNDGDLDLLISGATTNSSDGVTRLYRNDGGSFVEVATSLPNLTTTKAALGDYDNDGLADISLQGYTATGSYVGLWHNQGAMSFTETGIVTGQGGGTPVRWADFDNDGALDFILASSQRGTLYRNNAPRKNTPPIVPTSLNSSVSGASVMLSWSASSDPNQSGGLTYNVRIGSTPGQNDVLSPLANAASGYRTLPAMGNAQTRSALRVYNLVGGTYYWSVQAVDHAFAGSSFASERTFIINGPPTISDITNQLTFVNTPSPPIPFTATGMETAGVKLSLSATSSNPSLVPTNNIVFFGTGRNRTVTITPTANQFGTTAITVQVRDAYGATASDSFVLTVEGFTEMSAGFSPLWFGSAAWGDYDNDGDLDLLYNGQDFTYAPTTKLYRNNGNSTFTEVSAGLPRCSMPRLPGATTTMMGGWISWCTAGFPIAQPCSASTAI